METAPGGSSSTNPEFVCVSSYQAWSSSLTQPFSCSFSLSMLINVHCPIETNKQISKRKTLMYEESFTLIGRAEWTLLSELLIMLEVMWIFLSDDDEQHFFSCTSPKSLDSYWVRLWGSSQRYIHKRMSHLYNFLLSADNRHFVPITL